MSINFQYHQDVKQYMFLNSCLDSSCQAICGGKKEGKKEIKFDYIEDEKSFLDEIKSIFHNIWRALFW